MKQTERKRTMSIIYCLVPQSYWEKFVNKEEYVPRDYEQEGFIHTTKGDELLFKVANRVYAQYTGQLLVLVIDEKNVRSEVKYETAKGGNLYPHIYGPLNTDAITEVRAMKREDKGWTFA